jgi:hypothetical protein
MPAIDLGLSVTVLNNATAPLRQIAGDVKRVGDNAQATSNRLKAIQVVIAGILLEKTLELGKGFLEIAAKNQLADVQLSAFAGGMKNANAIMEHFNHTVAASGVENNDLASAFGRLRAAGLSQGDATKTIDNLVSGIVALGSKDVSGSLDNAVSAFQRFAAKSVVSTRELNALVHSTGLTVKELADSMGVTMTQFYDQLKDKTTSSQTLIDAFNRAATIKFGGFAEMLGSTVGGALNEFKFHLDDALGALGQNSGLDAHVALIIHNIDDAVNGFIRTISKKDIDNFFKMIGDAGPIVADIGDLILRVGIAVIELTDVVVKFAAMLPDEAIEFGIIGYVLMGKKGALLLGLIGAAAGKLKDLAEQVKTIAAQYNSLPSTADTTGNKSQYQTVLDSLNKKDPNSPVANMGSAVTYWLAAQAGNFENAIAPTVKGAVDQLKLLLGKDNPSGKANWLAKMIGTPEQLKALEDKLNDLMHRKINAPSGLSAPPENTQLAGQLAALRQETNNTIKSMTDKDALLQFQNAGDELGAKLQSIRNQTDDWNSKLNTTAVNIGKSKLPISEQAAFIARIQELEAQINKDTENAITLATKLNTLKQQNIALTQQQAQLALEQNAIAEQRSLKNLTDPFSAILAGTPGGTAQDQVDQQVLQYKQQIVQYQQQINNLQTQQLQDTANADVYQGTIDQLNQAISLTQKLADTTNVSTKMMSDFYGQLGQTMESDLANGISGLIQGTMTWRDVGRQVFGDLISLSVKFLLQLAEQQLFASVAQAASLATAAPVAAAMAAIWGPAAMAASIATLGAADATGALAYEAAMASSLVPLANGGIPTVSQLSGNILNGPTMFLGGEAGDEAVMPLTRIGGKLGVRSSGGGGNTYEINIHALDTQSGLQFIGKHISDIDAGLAHQRHLNRSARMK